MCSSQCSVDSRVAESVSESQGVGGFSVE